MTAPEHVVTLPKAQSRGPFAPVAFIPTCSVCGQLDVAMDLDQAKSARARHLARVAGRDSSDAGGGAL